MDEWREDKLKAAVLRVIQDHTGVHNAISSYRLTGFLKHNGYPELNQRTARAIIRELRRDRQPICSKSGRGYFWPERIQDVFECAEDMNHAARDMQYTASRVREAGVDLFGHQEEMKLW